MQGMQYSVNMQGMQHSVNLQGMQYNVNVQGMQYFISRGLVRDSALEIAQFIHGTDSLTRDKVRHDSILETVRLSS